MSSTITVVVTKLSALDSSDKATVIVVAIAAYLRQRSLDNVLSRE